MIISKEEVGRMAKLARLYMSEDEKKQATKELVGILEFFSKIGQVDTVGIKEALDMSDKKNVVRADQVETDKLCEAAELLAQAPETKDGLVKVKAVF